MAKETVKAKNRRSAKATTVALGAPKVTKRSSVPKNVIPKKRKPNTAVFGPDAPPARLRMPQNDNITAAELIVFLPNAIRSHDFLYRLMQNGLDTPTLTMIVNFHRRPTKSEPISINSFCKIIEKTMREAGHEKWTVGKHKAGKFRIGDEDWDGNNLTCAGFRLNCEEFPDKKPNERGVLDNVPFASLANDIERYPSEETGDALDLTRCIKFAAANAQLALQFPRDFGFLKRLTGGPSRVKATHRDYCVFNRWRMFAHKAKHIANADTTGFEMLEYEFTNEQLAIVNDYLERVENGEEPSVAESYQNTGSSSTSSSASSQASEHKGSSAIQVQASEDSGYSSTPTQTSEGSHSESMPAQSPKDCEGSSLIRSSEGVVENVSVQGDEEAREESGSAAPSWWYDGYEIKLSAQQPSQQPIQLYQGHDMPYFPSMNIWNNAHPEYSTTNFEMPFMQPNMMQYANGYEYTTQNQDFQHQGTGHQFHEFAGTGYAEHIDYPGSFGYDYSNGWANELGSL